MTASKFESAATGSSQIPRFLKPKGSPAPAVSASASTAHAPAASVSAASEHWLQSDAAGSMHTASEGAQEAAVSAVLAAANEAQTGSTASMPAEPGAMSSCPVDAQAAGNRNSKHAFGLTTMAQGLEVSEQSLAVSKQSQPFVGTAAAGALLPASAAPGENLCDGSAERSLGASGLADLGSDLGSLQHCPPAQCAEGAPQQERSEGRQQTLLSDVTCSSSTCAPAQTGGMAEISELHGAPVLQQAQPQRDETVQYSSGHADQQMLLHGEAGTLPEHASSTPALQGVDNGSKHLGGEGPHEVAVVAAPTAWPAQQAALQPAGESRKAQEGEPSRHSQLSQEVCTPSEQRTPVRR